MKRKIMATVVAGLLALSMIGCGSTSGSATDSKTTSSVAMSSTAASAGSEAVSNATAGGDMGAVGFSISTLNNPFFVSMSDGAKKKASELGVDLTIVDAGDDAAKQATDIEDLISKGIKVLIVNPVDSSAIAPTISDAQKAGVEVIAVDRNVEGDTQDSFIGTDNVAAGQQAGEAFLKAVGEGAKVAILEGIPGTSSAIERQEGFHKAIDGHVDIVASQTANYDRSEGLTVTENILQAHPDIKGILSANDEMALGALEACEAAGLTPGKDILVTGFDAGDDARAAVKEGKMLFTVEQETTLMGETAVETALKYMKGETLEKRYPISVTMITE